MLPHATKLTIKCALIILFWLIFMIIGPAYATSETRYMTANISTVNTLYAYNLETSQSSNHLTTSYTRTGSTSYVCYWGIRVWKIASDGTETEITSGTPVAVVSRSTNGQGIQSATWNAPQTALASTDAIVIRIYRKVGDDGPWALYANPYGVYHTEQLGASQLDAATWTVYLYTQRSTASGPSRTSSTFHWGDSTYNSRIENFTWSIISKSWNLVEIWTGNIITRTWRSVETWTGQLITRLWRLVEAWSGQLLTRIWHLVETWTGEIITKAWNLVETWTGSLVTMGWKFVEAWTGSLLTRAWTFVETWIGELIGKAWQLVDLWEGIFPGPLGPGGSDETGIIRPGPLREAVSGLLRLLGDVGRAVWSFFSGIYTAYLEKPVGIVSSILINVKNIVVGKVIDFINWVRWTNQGKGFIIILVWVFIAAAIWKIAREKKKHLRYRDYVWF